MANPEKHFNKMLEEQDLLYQEVLEFNCNPTEKQREILLKQYKKMRMQEGIFIQNIKNIYIGGTNDRERS